jgi:yecA family protein
MQRKQHAKLSAREARALGDFLSHADRPEGTLSFHELQGFLFAISCAPELIQPSEWLPLISNEEDMGFAI